MAFHEKAGRSQVGLTFSGGFESLPLRHSSFFAHSKMVSNGFLYIAKDLRHLSSSLKVVY